MAPRPLSIHDATSSSLRLGGDTPLLIVWGGLGFSRRPIRDLRDLYALYTDELNEFLQHCSDILQPLLVEEAAGKADSVKHGLMDWIAGPSKRSPSVSHATIMAVTTILQIARYVLLCKRLDKTPGDLARSSSAFTGHSVGLFVAIGMAAADSWESLYTIADAVITGTFYGERCASAVWDNKNLVSQASATDCMRRGEGTPSPMLSVAGVDYARLSAEMDVVNAKLADDRKLYLALTNDVDSYVAAGGPEGLVALCARLRAPTPTQRQGQYSLQFIPVSNPFHCPHLEGCTAALSKKMERFVINKSDMLAPVWELDSFLEAHAGEYTDNVLPLIGKLIYPRAVDWPGIMGHMSGRWQVLDFGPGGSGGVGAFINKMKSDPKTRVYTVCPTDTFGTAKLTTAIPPLLSVVSNDPNPQTYARVELAERCLPESNSGTQTTLSGSKFTEVMGLPRVLVAGMTPTTCDVDLVAAIMNAGFYVEFATGGYHDADSLAAAIKSLASKIRPGRFITLNIIYANPRGLSWMIPQITTLVRQGCPIGGITIGAGVPDAAVVGEWVKLMELSYIGLKPATSDAILQVLDIARAHPTLPVLLQWTGGRAGGHHSQEDFHQPLLDTYQAIREVNNVILVGGSGFGDAEGSWPFISGEWSQAFGRPPMPFDATLIGTCVMTTREAKTSPAVKKAMVDAPGVGDEDWLGTMEGGAGGVISIISHLGEHMHVLATRGMLLWSELDKTLFNLPKAKMLASLLTRRDELISRLNNDHQKVWFGLDYESMQPVDVCDMTYFSVLRRLLDLVHPERTGTWMEPSYRGIVDDWMVRIMERFGGAPDQVGSLADPREQLKVLAATIPESDRHLLSLEDADYFVDLCGKRGRKPVPFIPVLDAEFPVWFKKDPLWQSENLDATFHADPERVCNLAGPVALRHCTEADVPVADFLQGIEQGYLDKEASVGLSQAAASLVSPLYEADELAHLIGTSYVSIESDSVQIAQDCPEEIDNDLWLLLLGSKLGNWGRHLLGTKKLVSGERAYENPTRLIFKAQPGVLVRFSGQTTDGFSTAEMYVGGGQGKDGSADVKLSIDDTTITVLVFNPYTADGNISEFVLKFTYDISHPYAPISEQQEGQRDRLTDFLKRVFFGPDPRAADVPPTTTKLEFEVTKDLVLEWMTATDGQGLDIQSPNHLGANGEVPIEYSTILGMTLSWQLLLAGNWDVSRLLHRRTIISVKEGQRTLAIGDKLNVEWGLVGRHNTESGVDAEFRMTFFRNGEEAIGLVYLFSVLNERFTDEECFGTLGSSTWTLPLATEADIQILLSKSWFKPSVAKETFQCGQELEIELVRELNGKTTGQVWLQDDEGKKTLCAQVDPDSQKTNGADLVSDFMNRRAKRPEEQVRLPEAKALRTQSGRAFKIAVPSNSVTYSKVAKDFNPNHTLATFARYSGWREPICLGNQTAALVLKLIRQEVPGASVSTLRRYDCDFRSVVHQGDTLAVSIKQIAMQHGGTVLSFTAQREGSDEVVVAGVVELQAPPTAFLFTGQGSQFAGMGLDMIAHNRPSRVIWAEADEYFESNWGFTLSDIVKRNPTTLTVNFSSRQGTRVRESYLAAQSMLEDCDPSDRRVLFEGLHAKSRSFTFRHEEGMLSMTQFAQPAILVLERAAFEHLKSLGRVPKDACFAGHSLGEFAALGCMTEVWSLQAALKTVFIRGTLMQMAVPRDARGRSGFGMAALDPSRVRKGFTEEHLRELVKAVARRTGLVLEMVNLNVRGKQYVCAGDKRCLDILRVVTDALQASHSVPDIAARCGELIEEHAAKATSQLATDVSLKGGKALIPLPGIDVPFHSSTMSAMARLFRKTLVNAVDSEKIKTEELVGRWIPNVTGKPFSTDKAYVDMVVGLTGSARLETLAAAM